MTRGSHAPSLTTLVRRALADALGGDEKRAGCTLLVAVSGGPDSMALLDALAHVRERGEVRLGLVACGVDHGLRAEAGAELRLGAEHAARRGVPWVTRRVAVAPGASLQARAREARYGALAGVVAELAAGAVEGLEGDLRGAGGAVATLVATAHHAEDRAETFLLRLARGAGVNGLGVLPLRDGHLVRPLLRASRRDVMLHLERHGVPYAHDPSNQNRRFARVRLREEVLPALLALDPRFVEHVGAVCDELYALRDRLAPAPEEGELGRRTRELLGRLGPGAPRKMAVKLPKERVATYDRGEAAIVIRPAPPAPEPVGVPSRHAAPPAPASPPPPASSPPPRKDP